MKLRVPRRFVDATIDKIDQDQFKPIFAYREKIKENVEAGRGILLSGPPGIGKTFALVALTREAVKIYSEKRSAFDYEFVTSPNMFEQIPAFRGADEGDHTQDVRRGRSWVETYFRVMWLVINDLGKEYRAGAMQDQVTYKLGRILRERSEQCLPTFITTNLSLTHRSRGLPAVYGESITSLLSESVGCFEINGEDRRKGG